VVRAAVGLNLLIALAACGQPFGRAETLSRSPIAVASPQPSPSPSGPDCSNPDHLTRWRQQSMQPAIQPDDLLLITKEPTYAIGDIVAFAPPAEWTQSPGEPFVKRIVAHDGDSVVLRDGRVMVNGNVLVEPYVWPGHEPFGPTEASGDTSRWVVPSGAVFVLGDHRAVSVDSRAFGLVPATSILGRISCRCAPTAGPIS
jgi:signal peptidase I